MTQNEADMALAEKALAGDKSAWDEIKQLDSDLMAYYVSRGITLHDAQEVMSRIWADCFPTDPQKPSLLARYNGAGKLRQWLTSIGLNRAIDMHRRNKRMVLMESPGEHRGQLEDGFAKSGVPGEETEGVTQLISDAFKQALEETPVEERLMLRLIYFEGIQRQEIARCWNCSNSRITRMIQAASDKIKERTIEIIREREPWLDVSWQDVLKIAASVQKLTF